MARAIFRYIFRYFRIKNVTSSTTGSQDSVIKNFVMYTFTMTIKKQLEDVQNMQKTRWA